MVGDSLEVLGEAQRFIVGVMNPTLLARRQAAIKKFLVATMIPENGGHNLTAILDNVRSDTHNDLMDASQGYAAFMPLGDFEGDTWLYGKHEILANGTQEGIRSSETSVSEFLSK